MDLGAQLGQYGLLAGTRDLLEAKETYNRGKRELLWGNMVCWQVPPLARAQVDFLFSKVSTDF